MRSPRECLSDGNSLPACFFCQREAECISGATIDGAPLRHSRVRYQGRILPTLICKACSDIFGVPDRLPEGMRICHFCGYPGDIKETMVESFPSPPVDFHKLVDGRSARVVGLPRTRSTFVGNVCKQCRDLFNTELK